MNNKLSLVASHHVPELVDKSRLSDYTPGIFYSIPSRKGMKKAIAKGLVKVNGKTAYSSDYIKGGETIELFQEETTKKFPTIDLKIEVLFEDGFLALVNKPPGIEVSGNKKWILENAFASNLKPSSQKDALPRAQAIHRLDYPTSGVILVGKTAQSVILLNKLFEERKTVKIYHAIAIGEMKDSGRIESNVDGKEAITIYRKLQSVASPRFTYLNLLELSPQTGRKHQLRKHMNGLGNPILGDAVYGIEGLMLKGKGLYLHASSLSFTHPFTKEKIQVSAVIPKKFQKIFPDHHFEEINC